jgi:hypothetical protein
MNINYTRSVVKYFASKPFHHSDGRIEEKILREIAQCVQRSFSKSKEETFLIQSAECVRTAEISAESSTGHREQEDQNSIVDFLGLESIEFL